ITAKLQHPAIVAIHEAGVWPTGEPFYAMKLVAGTSLDEAIEKLPTLEKRLGLLPSVIAVVDALAYAHKHSIVHRDLKPANVLVGKAPYTGETALDTLRQVIEGPPPPLRARVPGVPGDLVAIVDKAMAYAATDRYPTAQELAADLKKFQTGQLVGAREYTTWQ